MARRRTASASASATSSSTRFVRRNSIRRVTCCPRSATAERGKAGLDAGRTGRALSHRHVHRHGCAARVLGPLAADVAGGLEYAGHPLGQSASLRTRRRQRRPLAVGHRDSRPAQSGLDEGSDRAERSVPPDLSNNRHRRGGHVSGRASCGCASSRRRTRSSRRSCRRLARRAVR